MTSLIADSSALIPIARAGKLRLLKKLYGKIRITLSVERETVLENRLGSSEIGEALGSWIAVLKSGKALAKGAESLASSENLSFADAEFILLAMKNRDDIFANDYRMSVVAKSKGLRVVWPTVFLLQCVKKKILPKAAAKDALVDLMKNGLRLSPEVFAAAQKLIEEV